MSEEPSFSQISNTRKLRPDCRGEIDCDNGTCESHVEFKGQASPEKTGKAIYQLKKYLSEIDASEKYYPPLIASHLNEDRPNRLTEGKVSGLNWSANGVTYVPGKIFTYRSGAKNKLPSNAPVKLVSYGSSSQVAAPRTAKDKIYFFLRPVRHDSAAKVLEIENKSKGRERPTPAAELTAGSERSGDSRLTHGSDP